MKAVNYCMFFFNLLHNCISCSIYFGDWSLSAQASNSQTCCLKRYHILVLTHDLYNTNFTPTAFLLSR